MTTDSTATANNTAPIMMILLVVYGFSPTDLSDSITELKKQTKNLGTHKERESYWQAYVDIQGGANKYSNIDIDGGKLYGLIKYYRSSSSNSSNDNNNGDKGRIEFEPFTKRQKALVGTPKLMMGRHIKLLLKEGDDDDGGGCSNSNNSGGKEFVMPWFGDEAEPAYRDITTGEECISIDSNRGVYVSTKIKRRNCAGPPPSNIMKSIDTVQEYISKLQPDTPLQSIAWDGHQPPKIKSYNVILTGPWPSSVTNNLLTSSSSSSSSSSLAHINTSSMDEIYELFEKRRNTQLINEAEILIDKMITEQNKGAKSDMTASIFTGSMKDLSIAKRNSLLKKVYISSAKKKFIENVRSADDGDDHLDMVVVNERNDSSGDTGKFEEYGGVVFETFYKLDLSIYG